jgi:hypothetical protein
MEGNRISHHQSVRQVYERIKKDNNESSRTAPGERL